MEKKYYVVVLTPEALEYTDSIGFYADSKADAWAEAERNFEPHEIEDVEIL